MNNSNDSQDSQVNTIIKNVIKRDGEKVDELDGELTVERVIKSIAGGDNK